MRWGETHSPSVVLLSKKSVRMTNCQIRLKNVSVISIKWQHFDAILSCPEETCFCTFEEHRVFPEQRLCFCEIQFSSKGQIDLSWPITGKLRKYYIQIKHRNKDKTDLDRSSSNPWRPVFLCILTYSISTQNTSINNYLSGWSSEVVVGVCNRFGKGNRMGAFVPESIKTG